MALNSFSDVQNFLDAVLTQNISQQTGGPEINDVAGSPHRNFWRNLTYDQFVNGNVPGVKDPTTNQPMRILVKGSSAKSNIILALSGAAGTAFDPDTGGIGPMPANGPPMFTPAQIKELADWIDGGCHQ